MLIAAWFVVAGALAMQGPAEIAGRVTLVAADGQRIDAPGVRLTLTCGAGHGSRTEVSDERGDFRFANVPIDSCSIVTDIQGFQPASATTVTMGGLVATVEFQLDVEPVYTGMTVAGDANALPRHRCHALSTSAADSWPIRSRVRCPQ